MERLTLTSERVSRVLQNGHGERGVLPPEISVNRHEARAEALPWHESLSAKPASCVTYDMGSTLEFDRLAADKKEEEHPENGKNFPLWKRVVLFFGDLSAYVSVFILISPIPFGWILVPASTIIISIAVGPKHAKRHILKVVNEWKDTFIYGTFADKWFPPLKRSLRKIAETIKKIFKKEEHAAAEVAA